MRRLVSLNLILVVVVWTRLSVGQVSAEKFTTDAVYHVPSFRVNELRSRSDSILPKLRSALSSSGLIAIEIQDSDSYANARHAGLSGLCSCAEGGRNYEDSLFRTVRGTDSNGMMTAASKTSRTTFATATIGDTPVGLPIRELTEACGFGVVHAMETLRDIVADASHAFVRSVDDILECASCNPIMKSSSGEIYPTVQSVIEKASHLEHFHVYRSNEEAFEDISASTFNESKVILDVHTDAGLFLTFVPGLRCDDSSNDLDDGSDFFVQLENGALAKAIFPPNTVGVLLGHGAQNWLRKGKAILKATKHAVHMPYGSARAWYGRMHLVPPQAIIQEYPFQRTFADMRQAMVLSGRNINKRTFSDSSPQGQGDNDLVMIGCGEGEIVKDHLISENSEDSRSYNHPRRRLQMVDDASFCNNQTNFYCWMSCLTIPDSENSGSRLEQGESLYCADPSVLAQNSQSLPAATDECNVNAGSNVIIGGAMNVACVGVWSPTDPDVPSTPVVPLNGTESTSPEELPWCWGGTSMYMDGFHWLNPTCVIFLFPNWILSTPMKLSGASLGTVVFGMSIEGVIRQRRHTVTTMPIGWSRLLISTLFYGLQLTMGYLIMLVVMTYSGPLFLSVILGFMIGHVVCNAPEVIDVNKNKKNLQLSDIQSRVNYNSIEASGTNVAADIERKTDPNTPESAVPDCCSRVPSTVPEGVTPCCQNAL